MTDGLGEYPDGAPRGDALAEERLRLRASMNLTEIIGVTLDALIPAYADAAFVYASEELLRGSGPGIIRPVRPDDSGRMAVRRAGSRFADAGPGREIFPPGRAVVFGPGSPYTRCVSERKPVAFTRPDDWTLGRMSPGGRAVISLYSAHLAVPLDAGGTAAGLIVLCRGSSRAAFSSSDTAGIMRLACYSGTSIASVIDSVRQQVIASTMQRGLIPAVEPEPPTNLDVSAACQPASGQLVGGDWYDIIGLPGGRTGIVIGDVMGHGAEASVIMAQLRSAARVLAQMDMAPAELLSRLNTLIMTLSGAPLASCMYAVIDPAMESCILATAGHLSPVLARPGHGARVVELPSSLSLGVSPSDFAQASIRLHAGAVIAFCTDGLVETRHRSFDQGISVLCAELGCAGDSSLSETRDTIIRSLATSPEDDVTLILVRIPGSG